MKKAKLDVTKLYGFKIVAFEEQSSTGAPITMKIGEKGGVKTGSRVGAKIGSTKTGSKIGGKTGAPVQLLEKVGR